MAVFFVPPRKFGTQCNTVCCFFPCKKCQFVASAPALCFCLKCVLPASIKQLFEHTVPTDLHHLHNIYKIFYWWKTCQIFQIHSTITNTVKFFKACGESPLTPYEIAKILCCEILSRRTANVIHEDMSFFEEITTTVSFCLFAYRAEKCDPVTSGHLRRVSWRLLMNTNRNLQGNKGTSQRETMSL